MSTQNRFLAAGPFDLVMIGSPNHLHYEHLLAAFEAGFYIFCENTIVRTEGNLRRFRLDIGREHPAALSGSRHAFDAHRARDHRAHRFGQIGEIVSMDTTEHLPPEHGGYLARNWRRKQEWGGSFMLDKVCHDFDIFGRLVGARPSKVASFGGKRIFHAGRENVGKTYSDGSAAYACRGARPGRTPTTRSTPTWT